MPRQRIAILGASGFVGSTLCEHLYFSQEFEFTPFVTESRHFLIRRLTGGTPRAYSQRDVSCHADLGLDLAQRAWRERRLT